MQFISYWHDTAPAFAGAAGGAVQGHYDAAVIGAGFTGLGAARRLAMEGRSVVVLEAQTVGFGASGRNGGHLNNGIAHGYLAARAEFGAQGARALYHAFDAGVDFIERLVAEEGIDCAFRRAGKLKLASKPEHMQAIRRNFAAIHAEADPDTALLTRDELRAEIGSDAFHGAMLQQKSAVMHMGRFVTGLARAAVRHGAVIHEQAPVTARVREAGGWLLHTPRGAVTADKVLLATGAYTTEVFPWFRRRIVPVGSFLLATRPLGADEVAAIMPGNRTCVTTLNIGNYFRLSPDNRLIFGGRARFSARSDQQSDAKSGAILRRAMTRIFPQLGDVQVDYCWGGLVDMTQDRYPRAGEVDGLHYAMGYSGHGAQIASLMGEMVAERMLGHPTRSPFAGLPWAAVPFHTGKPWFLPLVGLYYKAKDMVQ
jgi:glycine/D-amino acid oxidase-like deaminating enzyme